MSLRQGDRLKFLRWLLICLLALTAGCSRTVEFTLPKNNLEVYVRDGSSAKGQCTITVDSEPYRQLQAWLSANTSGWYPTRGTIPSTVHVVGGSVNLEIARSELVVSDSGVRYSKSIKASDLSFVTCGA